MSRVRPRLLLFLTAADHPARDAACATLGWIAEEEGQLFECYYSAPSVGGHYGGGDPSKTPSDQLRGGTFVGSHHLEQFLLLLQQFECELVCLGPSIFDPVISDLQLSLRAREASAHRLYSQMLAGSAALARGCLVVGGGGHPQGINLAPYAFPEVYHRRLLAIPESDVRTAQDWRLPVEGLWLDVPPQTNLTLLDPPREKSVAVQTAWMARRWCDGSNGFLLADPEVVGRWTPTAIRKKLLPVFAVPQRDILRHVDIRSGSEGIVYGRQQDDRDFLELSRAGLAFQLVDPGRPAFPVQSTIRPAQPSLNAGGSEPSDDQLRAWAREGRVLTSLLFWTGMLREMENLYALSDALAVSRVSAGLIFTTASFEHLSGMPPPLRQVDPSLGGLSGQVEILLASGGSGAFLESEVPVERFRDALRRSMDQVSGWLGTENRPRGWWSVMDAPLVPTSPPKFTFKPEAPYVSIRYPGSNHDGPSAGGIRSSDHRHRRSIRQLRRAVRRSALGSFFEPLRPFDAYAPGPPRRELLEAVREAGFEYALTKAAFGGRPTVVTGIEGLTVLNYTVGRWDGWTPFVTINTLGDLRSAERRLLRRGPGWLLGTLDTCLWAFSGTALDRGRSLLQICRWVAGGGSSGKLVNVRPGVVARYAKVLAEMKAVDTLEPS